MFVYETKILLHLMQMGEIRDILCQKFIYKNYVHTNLPLF